MLLLLMMIEVFAFVQNNLSFEYFCKVHMMFHLLNDQC